MGVRFLDPHTAETVKFIRVAVNLGLVAVLALQQVPWVHRRLAALGFSPPSPLVCWRFAASPAHLAKAADAFRRAVAGTPDPRE